MTPENNELHKKFIQYGMNAKEWVRRCALLLPEIDKNRIWAQKGFGSIFEYAAKLAGMSRASVEDALRILYKIEDKPALKKVVEEKGLNAVRPIVTLATKETDDFWAQKAREMSKNTLAVYAKEFRPTVSRTGPEIKSETKTITMQLVQAVAAQLEKLKGQGD